MPATTGDARREESTTTSPNGASAYPPRTGKDSRHGAPDNTGRPRDAVRMGSVSWVLMGCGGRKMSEHASRASQALRPLHCSTHRVLSSVRLGMPRGTVRQSRRLARLAAGHSAVDHVAPLSTRTVRSPSLPVHRPPLRAGWLLLVALVAGVALWRHGPIAQWPDYHRFADARAWGAIPNAANVLSSLAFLAVGAWGLRRWRRSGLAGPAHAAWGVFGAALLCTAPGSAAYHWAPGNDMLALDRLPIAWACAALLCGLLAERVDPRWSRVPVLAGALLAATLSVAAWWIGERGGQGDLRPYAAVQFLPMLIVPAVLVLRLPATGAPAVPPPTWAVVLALYAAAKLMETVDAAVLDALALVSGHTHKHQLAAAAAGWQLRAALQLR